MSRELRYALVAGFLTIIWMSLAYAFGWEKKEIGKYAPVLSLVILAAAIYVSILTKRDKDLGGIISFKDAFVTGISVSFVIGLIVGIFLMVYTQYVNPDYVNQIIKDTTEYYQTQHETKEQIDRRVEGIRAAYSTFGQLTFGIGRTMLVAAFVTLICSAVMRRGKAVGSTQ